MKETAETVAIVKSGRLRGVESESALQYASNETCVEADLKAVNEKRKRLYRVPRRTLSQDKAQFRKYLPSRGGSEIIVTSTSQSSVVSPIRSVSHSVSAVHVRDYGQDKGKTVHEVNAVEGTEESGDRIVSTSYSESLDQLFQLSINASKANQQRRLSMLPEEISSQPTKEDSVYDGQDSDQANNIQITIEGTSYSEGITGGLEDFIQYTSAEILYQPKQKVAKTVGRYLIGETLGEGSYGKVKEGFCTETLRRVAIKIMKPSRLKKIASGEQNMRHEITLLKKLNHKNVVELMDVLYKSEKQKTYIVFGFCATTLAEVISRSPHVRLPLSQAQRYFIQLIKGLEYLHSRGIVHRDVKPGNILLTFDETVKISDFGVAEEISMFVADDSLTSSSGSPAFQPPEVALGYPCFSGVKVDIWAAGVTLYHMISGRYPFDGENIYALMEAIGKCEYQIPDTADEILGDLLVNIMEKDPKKRFNLEAITNHTWMHLQISKSPLEVPVIGRAGTFRHGSNISNPLFSEDTTLIPFLETMFDDIPTSFRRQNVYREQCRESRMKNELGNDIISDKFLRRMSRPFVLASQLQTTAHERPRSTVSANPAETPDHVPVKRQTCKMQ